MTNPEEIQPSSSYDGLKDHSRIIRRGWNVDIAGAVVNQSRKLEMANLYPRDRYQRFPDLKAANNWFDNDPSLSVYTLKLGQTADLAGIIWISNNESDRMADVSRMFNMRIYESDRGRSVHELVVGLGKAALEDDERLGHDDDLGSIINREDPWLKVYKDIGFREFARPKLTDNQIKLIRDGFLSRESDIAKRHI